MSRRPTAASVAVLVLLASSVATAGEDWMQWRGPSANGAAPSGDPPVKWDEQTNIAWKVAVPGRGLSSPIVHAGRVYVTTAVPVGERVPVPGHAHEHDDGAHDNVTANRSMSFDVLAYDAADGSVAWQTTVRSELPHEPTHVTGSWASASAVTDGTRLYVSFGSRGLYALDLQGKIVWETDLGNMQVRHAHGEGSSPALWGDTLVVNWDHQGDSFLVALDTSDGKVRWKTPRDEITSWSSPRIVEVGEQVQVIVAATNRVRAYDLADGKQIWECAGLSRNVVATPVAANGMVFVGNSYDWKMMLAIRLAGAKGDITGTDQVVWSRDRDTPYVPSPALHDGTLYFLKHSHGFLTAVDAATGKPHYGPVRLGAVRNVFASPVVAGGRLYIPSRDGATAVVQTGSDFKLLAINVLDDSFSASPAVAGDALYLRGDRHLYRIAAPTVGERQSSASPPAGESSK